MELEEAKKILDMCVRHENRDHGLTPEGVRRELEGQ